MFKKDSSRESEIRSPIIVKTCFQNRLQIANTLEGGKMRDFSWKKITSCKTSSEMICLLISWIIQVIPAFLILTRGLPAFQTVAGIRILDMMVKEWSLICSTISSRLIRNSIKVRASNLWWNMVRRNKLCSYSTWFQDQLLWKQEIQGSRA